MSKMISQPPATAPICDAGILRTPANALAAMTISRNISIKLYR